MDKKRLYIAGPFSTPDEKKELTRMIDALKQECEGAKSFDMDIELYIPMEFSVEDDFQKEDGTWNLPNQEWARQVYDNDIKELKKCDAMVCMYTGHRGTTGTAFESGYAKALGKPIIGYIPEFAKNENMSLMILNSIDHVMYENGMFEMFKMVDRGKFNQK